MLEQFYSNVLEALKMTAGEARSNSTHTFHKHHIPGWNKDVEEKHKVARHTCLY